MVILNSTINRHLTEANLKGERVSERGGGRAREGDRVSGRESKNEVFNNNSVFIISW